jgi:enoyl-CoA hydratase/carnithine racemase
VTRLTLDSPANANALSRRLVEELLAALESAAVDPSTRAVVLASRGRSFCSGLDLKAATRGERPDDVELPRLLRTVVELPKPVVAAVDGAVRGGGMGLVAACDIAVAGPQASFAFSEVRLGVTASIISVVCVRRMTARSLSLHMLTGDVFGPGEALKSGLVSELAGEPGQLEERISAITAAFASAEPGALAGTKQLLREVPAMPPDEAWAHTAAQAGAVFSSPAAAEGIAAFLEKRRASWVLPPELP